MRGASRRGRECEGNGKRGVAARQPVRGRESERGWENMCLCEREDKEGEKLRT